MGCRHEAITMALAPCARRRGLRRSAPIISPKRFAPPTKPSPHAILVYNGYNIEPATSMAKRWSSCARYRAKVPINAVFMPLAPGSPTCPKSKIPFSHSPAGVLSDNHRDGYRRVATKYQGADIGCRENDARGNRHDQPLHRGFARRRGCQTRVRRLRRVRDVSAPQKTYWSRAFSIGNPSRSTISQCAVAPVTRPYLTVRASPLLFRVRDVV